MFYEGTFLDCDRCGNCCIETSMQLSHKDLRRLAKRGYNPTDFTINVGGFQTLRNLNGACYFFDRRTKTCRVYRDRPEGCRYYPIVYSINEEKPIIDREVCKKTSTITKAELEKTALRLAKLAKRIMQNKKSHLEE